MDQRPVAEMREEFRARRDLVAIGVPAPGELFWTVELWANNLFNKDYIQVGFNGPFQVDENNDAVSVYNAFLGAPRSVVARSRVCSARMGSRSPNRWRKSVGPSTPPWSSTTCKRASSRTSVSPSSWRSRA